MCAGLILGGIGTGLAAVSTYRQVQAQNAAAEYNARAAEMQARQAQVRASREEAELRRRGRRLIGQQRVGFAASGVELGTGTPEIVNEQTEVGIEQDALDIRYNLALEQYGFKSQARLLRAQRQSPLLPVASTLLAGTSSLASQFLR